MTSAACRYLPSALAAILMILMSVSAFADDTLVYCSEGSPEGFDPALYTTGTTFDASSRQLYNRLLEFERGTTTVIPGLAENYRVSEDGLEYLFTLRAGVSFHTTDYFTPTRELNADDVVFSFQRQLDVEHPYYQVSGGTWEYSDAMSMPDLVSSIEALDARTVRLVLTRPVGPMVANLAMDFASILSLEYAMKLLEDGTPELLNLQPIGTGPFRFASYEPDSVVRYQAHDQYWAGKAAIDNLIFSITPDSTMAYEKLTNGDCHVLGFPDPSDIDSIRSNADLTVLEQAGMDIGYLAYNTTVPPFDNVNVRRALNMAINKQAMLDVVFEGTGAIASNPIPPTVWSYDESIPDDLYSPGAARAMLEAEGVQNLKMEIWAMPVIRPYNPNGRLMAELIQQNFATIGVEASIVSYEWGEYLKLSRELDRKGAVLFGWSGDNGDPDNFLSVLLSCDAVGSGNRAQWCYEPFDQLVRDASVVSDQQKRAALYREAQAIFKQQAPWATLAHSITRKAVRNEVRDFRIDPFGGHIFYGVSLVHQ